MFICSIESHCSKEKGYTFLRDILLCIKLHQDHVNQSKANSTCYQEGGYLLKIDNPVKQTYIQQFGKFKSNYKMNLIAVIQVNNFTWQIIMKQKFNIGRATVERTLRYSVCVCVCVCVIYINVLEIDSVHTISIWVHHHSEFSE